jgi:hypothetical protein
MKKVFMVSEEYRVLPWMRLGIVWTETDSPFTSAPANPGSMEAQR